MGWFDNVGHGTREQIEEQKAAARRQRAAQGKSAFDGSGVGSGHVDVEARRAREEKIAAEQTAQEPPRKGGSVSLASSGGGGGEAPAVVPEQRRMSPAEETARNAAEMEALGLLPSVPRGGGGTRLIKEGTAEVTSAEDAQMEGMGEVAERHDENIGERGDVLMDVEIANEAAQMDAEGAQAATDEKMLELESERDKALDQANQAIDPNRYEKNLTTGEKVRNVFAQLLSGAGQAMLASQGMDPGENLALAAINQDIERDIQAQQEQIEAGKRKLEAVGRKEGKLYKDLDRQLGSIDKVRQAKLLEAEMELQKIADTTKDVVARESALASMEDIRKQRGALKAKRGRGMNAARGRAIRERRKVMTDLYKDNLKQGRKIELEEVKGEARAAQKGSTYVPGVSWKGGRPDSKALATVREAQASYKNVNGLVNRLESEVNKLGGMDRAGGKYSEQLQRVKGIHKQLQVGVAKAMGGVITSGDLMASNLQIGEPGGINPVNELVKLREFKKTLDNKYQRTVEAYGGELSAGERGPRSARARGR